MALNFDKIIDFKFGIFYLFCLLLALEILFFLKYKTNKIFDYLDNNN